MSSQSRLKMELGESIFTLRAIRRFKSIPIPDRDLLDILEAAIRAPSGGNSQPWHFLLIQDLGVRKKLASLYHEAWWAKRKDSGIMGPQDILPGNGPIQSAMRLADEIGQSPAIIIVCATSKGPDSMASVIPAVQNLLLAARGLGVGGTITTLHKQVEERVHKLLNIPESFQIVYCIPLGYPAGNFGPVKRKSLNEVVSYDYWGNDILNKD